MHWTKDYSKSPAPAFDAVEDIKEYLGQAEWDRVSPMMAKCTNPMSFTFGAIMLGIQGFPISAWYDLYQGQGAYQKAREALTGASHA